MRPCNRIEKKVCIKERKNLFLVQRKKRGSERIHSGIDKEEIYSTTKITTNCTVLQTQDLRVDQMNKPCIGLTQENLIENSVQYCLPYIVKPHGPCDYYFSLP